MAAVAERAHVLRVHADASGVVWYGDDACPAVRTGLTAEGFVGLPDYQGELAEARVVRLLGCKQNAALVVALQHRRVNDQSLAARQRLQLSSPAVCGTVRAAADPEAVLHRLWQPPESAVRHGLWHDFTTADFCTYSMIAALRPGPGEVGDLTRRLARYHPAWLALSFIPGLSVPHACRLVCEVVDPCWFRHPSRPGRLSRLYAYLGLTPANAAAFLGQGTPGRHYDRATVAMLSWYNRASVAAFNAAAATRPEDFLWRVYAARRGPQGVLAATRRLVAFTAGVWTASAGGHAEMRFDPDAFFGAAEADAWRRHEGVAKKV
jgi:hypothetical protein